MAWNEAEILAITEVLKQLKPKSTFCLYIIPHTKKGEK
jgi:hypothetical protein